MVAADDAKDVATVQQAGFIDLGVLKGNIGDQNYTLGSDVDLGNTAQCPSGANDSA